jgi:TfoX/Sxy family transcriptional regulator of competence genes
MQIPKPTESDKGRFRALLTDEPGTEVKAMFGNLGAFVNGNMFAGLFGADIGVKVDSTDQVELAAAGGGPFGPSERPMSGYLTLPESILSQPEIASAWITRARHHVGTLPAKASKAKKVKQA